jgi:hypothetical protein
MIMAGLGRARQGMAWLGVAGQGSTWQGMAGHGKDLCMMWRRDEKWRTI